VRASPAERVAHPRKCVAHLQADDAAKAMSEIDREPR
jgi:hypothetical protein